MADETSTTEASTTGTTALAEAPASTAKTEAAPAPVAPSTTAARPVPARKPAAIKAAPAASAAKANPVSAKKVNKIAAKAAPKAAAPRKPASVQSKLKALPAPAAVSTTTLKSNEGMRTMFNDTNVAERFQAVFGDANERAKNVIERNTRFAEELTELGRGNVEAVVASSKVAARGFETIGQEVAEFGRKTFEDASATLKSLAEVKSPADFFRLQSEFARTQFDALVAESSKLSETVIKLAGEVAEPITNRATVAAERVRSVAAL
ncbi:phasin family protein [Sphingosinicella sp. BN140058]|nr:phasin family protein [Sphingosinicella sp. BN140058]